MEAEKTYTGAFPFIRKHFHGEYSLARSFWVNSILLQAVCMGVGIGIARWLEEHHSVRSASSTILALMIFGYVIWLWGIIGTWASSNKHVDRGGHPAWANLTKVMIILGILRSIAMTGQMIEPMKEHWKIARGQKFGPAVSFELRADGKSLLMTGDINDGTADALAKALDKAPSVTTVVLYSYGGWVNQGRQIAQVIAGRGLHTYVEKECSSACTIAFLAGKSRAMEPGARLGFHAFKAVGINSTSANATTAQNTYRKASLSDRFIEKITSTAHDKMWYPSQQELLEEGVLSRISKGGESATLATVSPTREKLVGEFLKFPIYATISEKYPDDFKKIVDKAWEKVQAKRTDLEVVMAARKEVNQLVSKLLPIATDASLIEFNQLLIAQTQALSEEHSEACVELIFPTGKELLFTSILPPDLIKRESAWSSQMIAGSDPKLGRQFTQSQQAKILGPIFVSFPAAQAQFLNSAKLRAAAPDKACLAVIAYLSELNKIPEHKRGQVLRALYSMK